MSLPYSKVFKTLEEMFVLQILLQNPFINEQNGRLQSVGWLVDWLMCACAH